MSYFFDASIPHDVDFSISVALWVVSLCFAVVCAVTWELLGDTPDSLVPTTPMSFALSICNLIANPFLSFCLCFIVPSSHILGDLCGFVVGVCPCWALAVCVV